MAYLNKVVLLGNVGQNPRIVPISGDRIIASFPLATSVRVKGKGDEEYVEFVTWHRIVAFGYHANLVEKKVKKGVLLHIEGSLTHREWVKKESEDQDAKNIISEVVLNSRADKISVILTRKNRNEHAEDSKIPPPDDDDILF